MKNSALILFLFFVLNSYSQTELKEIRFNDSIKSDMFLCGDQILRCGNCKYDLCGNLIDTNNAIVCQNNKISIDTINTLYIVNNNVLINSKIFQKLLNDRMIVEYSLINCNDGIKFFGEIAKNGIISIICDIALIKSISLQNLFRKKYKNNKYNSKNIFINSYKSNIEFRIAKNAKIKLHYNKNENKIDLNIN